ncbi:MAG: hypothetical protein Q9216_004289 [Gyalolechia sp. 2 TL-2023]
MASEQSLQGNTREYEDTEPHTNTEQHNQDEQPSTIRFLDLESPPSSPLPPVEISATNELHHPTAQPLPIEAAIPLDVSHLLDPYHPSNLRGQWIPAIQQYMMHKAALFRLYRLEKTHRLATECKPLPMHAWGFNDNREEPTAAATAQPAPPPPQHGPSSLALAHLMLLTLTRRPPSITSDPRSPLNRNPLHDLPAGLSAVFPLPEPSLNRYRRQ